ncbi:hypothetical protein MtrunA17_Chr3g0112201 [Medicago truncatula]|uniref:Uncharacterized protein n=1 Tax=Medicago truncatula TaxID=3880 RepID=A0A072V029_MEDTR|nr:hypothetical protein MTR_3g068120 [Medicago truncatula]RHN68280.1 hypothetical protein MtrunA17_Chr3g0112201 [Medicago truncatula]
MEGQFCKISYSSHQLGSDILRKQNSHLVQSSFRNHSPSYRVLVQDNWGNVLTSNDLLCCLKPNSVETTNIRIVARQFGLVHHVSLGYRAGNEPNQLEYSSELDSKMNSLNLVHEPNELNLS